ncbi:MAG TPA: hypothetical protein VK629_12890 [Steroidobacteraceae bacterium]|nr:hypothetical protein [Steroidobacteraceae bacterium]
MNPELLMPDNERYEQTARRYAKDGEFQAITLQECGMCGYLEFVSAGKYPTFGYVIEPLETCPKCREAHQRSPELHQWILNVVAKAQKDSKK